MKYLISKGEITRRKKAYLTFSLNLIIGLLLGMIIFQFPLNIYIFLAAIFALFLVGLFSSRFFIDLNQTTIYLNDKDLLKQNNSHIEKYLLSDFDRVEVKWTYQKTIREIYIWLKGGRAVFITALDNFLIFKNELLKKLESSVQVKERHEPIEYDHPLFYIVLGLLIGFLIVLFFKFLINLDFKWIKISLYFFSIYSAVLGIYFFIAKPISKRSGERTKFSDYIAGIFMILIGLFIFLVKLF